MQRVLITGGCGYVGREVVARAVDHCDVHVLDNLRSGAHRLLSMQQDRFTLHQCDLRDRAGVRQVMTDVRPDIVIHLAAIHFIPLCEADPQLAIETNVSGTVNLLEATPQGARFVNASSAAVYAPVEGTLIEGETPVGPMDVYGWTKLHAEQLAAYFAQRRQFDAWNVRLFNVIGLGETNPHLLPEMVYQLKRGASQLHVGNITPRRDFIDVEDAAEGFFRLALAPNGALPSCGPDAVVNLGTGRSYAVRDILNQLVRMSTMPFDVVTDLRRVRAVDRPVLQASTERLAAVLKWVPSRPLDETVARLWSESADDLRYAVMAGEPS